MRLSNIKLGFVSLMIVAFGAGGCISSVGAADSEDSIEEGADVSSPVSGGLAPAQIQAVVRASMPKMRACYEALLAKDPKAEGKILLQLTIDADGAVTGSSLDPKGTTIGDESFGACVLDVADALQFPEGGEGQTKVSYPIVLTPT